MNLERSEIPLVATVKPDAITEKAIAPFDVTIDEVTKFYPWLPPEISEEYNIGLIVGNSGSGKSLLLKRMANGGMKSTSFHRDYSIAAHFESPEAAQEKLYAVGMNSVPKWKLPFHTLSNGEQHRVYVARNLVTGAGIDEFTSVVDRTVAKSLSVAVGRYIRKNDIKNIIFAACHFDIVPFLKPDWIIDTDGGTFTYQEKVDTSWYAEHIKGNSVGSLLRQ